MFEATILKHSVNPQGHELVTFEVCYPHAIHKDIMTHRWARNFQSFRAFPPEKVIEQIEADPFRPEIFHSRVKGMGEGEAVRDQALATALWQDHIDHSISTAKKMMMLGLAKAQINFVIQDLAFIRGIITTTMPQLSNFFSLRLAEDEKGDPLARPEVYKIALMMWDAYIASRPHKLHPGDWHLPLVIDHEELLEDSQVEGPNWEYWRKVSVGRCARVSYLTHDGKRDPEADIALHDRLVRDGHLSPFEHQGTPIVGPMKTNTLWKQCGSFGIGWIQYRKLIPNEANYGKARYNDDRSSTNA